MADDYERLIVLLEARVDAFDKAMQAAERRGTTTYQKLQSGALKATTDMQARINAMARSNSAAMDMVAGKTEAAAERSAKSYQSWWREAERARDKINQLRSSLDPAFAAQMRYDQAVEELNDALRRNIITEAEHRQVLDQVSAAYVTSGRAAGAHTGVLGSLGTMSDSTKAKLQNAGFQVQDVAVQMMAGTDAARALAMQLPQLLGGFGLLGVVLGTLASIGLPLLASMFGEGEGAAKDFDAAIGAVRNSIAAMNEQAAIYTAEGLVALKEKYGEVNLELVRFIDLQTQIAQMDALKATRDSLALLKEDLAGGFWGTGDIVYELQQQFGVTLVEANKLYAAMRRIDEARTFEDQLAAVTQVRAGLERAAGGIGKMTAEQRKFFDKLVESEDALRQLVATQPKQGWLSAGIAAAETLAGKLWEAVRANAALAKSQSMEYGQTTGSADWAKNSLGFTLPGKELLGLPETPGKGSGGGGGGGSSRIDGLIAELQTERETVEAWYAESLALLNGATEAELAAVGGKHEALERLELEHQERLKGIRDTSQTGMLADMDTFFGGMASLTKAGGERMLGAHRAFSAAQGIINSYTAFTEVLKDPSFIGRPWARFGAAAAALSSGLAAVASIRSGGGGRPSAGGTSGGGGAGSSGGDTGGNATGPLRASITPLDPSALFTGAAVRKLLDGLQEEAGNRGLILGWQP